ncbi:hypothetical protein [Methanobrevibacter sp.]|uniref:hypothetical protein n=1 Tax=Methanobrevibacter sp. TaxID=66852 RepID=UPI00388DFF15
MEDKFKSSESAVKRNIYGRIYYAVFLCVRQWLTDNTGYVSYAPGEHSRMPRYIKSKGPFDNKINQKISDDIIDLKKLRHQSDYYLKKPSKYSQEYENWVFEDIEYAFSIANNIIKDFNNLGKVS